MLCGLLGILGLGAPEGPGQGGFVKDHDLAGIEAAVAGEDEADNADKGEGVHIDTAEHFHAEDDGGQGRIGDAAEKAHQAQSGGEPWVQSQKAAPDTAEGGTNAEGRHDLTAFEPGAEGNGSKQKLHKEAVPVCLTVDGIQGHVHPGTVEPLVPQGEGQGHQ